MLANPARQHFPVNFKCKNPNAAQKPLHPALQKCYAFWRFEARYNYRLTSGKE